MKTKSFNILMADDDPDDRMLVKDALGETTLPQHLDTVEDGEELMAYLKREGKYANLPPHDLPGLILLDLNMPMKDGREALRELKNSPKLRRIPVVILTTSNATEDIQKTYDLGANSFIIKPRNFETLVQSLQTLVKYWFDTVQLPANRD
jgi:CheY-like chemotaxis protein